MSWRLLSLEELHKMYGYIKENTTIIMTTIYCQD